MSKFKNTTVTFFPIIYGGGGGHQPWKKLFRAGGGLLPPPPPPNCKNNSSLFFHQARLEKGCSRGAEAGDVTFLSCQQGGILQVNTTQIFWLWQANKIRGGGKGEKKRVACPSVPLLKQRKIFVGGGGGIWYCVPTLQSSPPPPPRISAHAYKYG